MGTDAFTVTIEPVARCNLDCRYCYSPRHPSNTLMPDAAREALQAIAVHAAGDGFHELCCVWLGGEPLLAGRRFFERVLSDTAALNLPVRHFVQTNGLLLDDAWCSLFRDAGVNVGVSIDGPREIHDTFRVSSDGAPTHSRVMDAIALLRNHNVPFGCVAVVSRATLGREQEVYDFFRSLGVSFRINPVIPGIDHRFATSCIEPDEYGAALIRFFDAWLEADMTRVGISPLDSYLAAVAGGEPSECQHQYSCIGHSLGVKPDSRVAICGRFGDATLGRFGHHSVSEMLEAPACAAIRERPQGLGECVRCINWSICHGGCPHNAVAFGLSPTSRDPFCPAYKAIFTHIRATLDSGEAG